MSLIAFQEAFARLVAEPGFADSVRAGRPTPGLSEREHARLVAAARDPGLSAATSVHLGWRLSKLLGLLPLTCAALGAELAGLASAFWALERPRSLYFQREAVAFCRFVIEADGLSEAVREVASFEAASIELDLGPDDGGTARVELRFTHDPGALLAAAAATPSELAAVPETNATVIGRRGAHGRHSWTFVRARVPA